VVNKHDESDEPPHSPERTMLFIISLLCVCVVMFAVFTFVLQFGAEQGADLKLIGLPGS
jgi:hypothetical protein